MAAYASGLVAMVAGDTEPAEEALREAWGTFDRIGYDVRASLASLALYRATGKARWMHLADEKLEQYPRSWLARKMKESSGRAAS